MRLGRIAVAVGIAVATGLLATAPPLSRWLSPARLTGVRPTSMPEVPMIEFGRSASAINCEPRHMPITAGPGLAGSAPPSLLSVSAMSSRTSAMVARIHAASECTEVWPPVNTYARVGRGKRAAGSAASAGRFRRPQLRPARVSRCSIRSA